MNIYTNMAQQVGFDTTNEFVHYLNRKVDNISRVYVVTNTSGTYSGTINGDLKVNGDIDMGGNTISNVNISGSSVLPNKTTAERLALANVVGEQVYDTDTSLPYTNNGSGWQQTIVTESVPGTNSIAIGTNAGLTSQSVNAVAIGIDAGNNTQGPESVAIGRTAGRTTQGVRSVSIGASAGDDNQGSGSVAVGAFAGQTSQGQTSVSIGQFAGWSNQGDTATAVGPSAGRISQGERCLAVGAFAGAINQGVDAVAIGTNAGNNAQGTNAVAIGRGAGQVSQHNNSIVINASGSTTNTVAASSTLIDPVRAIASAGPLMQYNNATKEISYDSTGSTPASATATGVAGTITWDADYIYVCTAANTWKRVAIATWP